MIIIREATQKDAQLIVSFINALADYEKATPEQVKVTVEDIQKHGFGAHRVFYCLIAEWEGYPAGFALYFLNYSTWEGKPGIYLEDLFVLPEYRKHKIGFALLQQLAKVALEKDCTRMVWQVLDWNELAINFYKSLGSSFMNEWITCRLEIEAITALALKEL